MLGERLESILWLGRKELASLARDAAMVGLIIYAFTYAVYGPAKGAQMELRNASVAIADEDRSELSGRITDALLPPFFKRPEPIDLNQIDATMDAGRYTFVLDIPPRFQADLEAGRKPTVQLNVDATAMAQAGHGAAYIQTIIAQEVQGFVRTPPADTAEPVRLITRAKFNPNLIETWFLGVSQIINNITMLAIILSGAAVVREREHGTIEHLLVMPLTPADIMLAKIWSSALVIVIVSTLSLRIVVQGMLDVPIAGSVSLFMVATGDLHVFGCLARYSTGHGRALDAPVWAARHSGVPGSQHTLGWADTVGQHAAMAAEGHAILADHAFRQLVDGDPVSRRGPDVGVAGFCGGGWDGAGVLPGCLGAF